eukprot:TRINITY_DN87364_c0_g1_i1.p1 TRINITY_DN87364_c0_g1~~TRINITY_DN87364_c0_g1_i1.p1  ORF type:complete len:430 (-),score=62.11 TRINITY_DN87364_c0_g1_i1:100-1389(-)
MKFCLLQATVVTLLSTAESVKYLEGRAAPTDLLAPLEHNGTSSGFVEVSARKSLAKRRVASSALVNQDTTHGTYNDETPVVFMGRELPVTVEGIFALLFVCLIASVPIVMGCLEKVPTKTHYVQSAVLLVWLVTCLYLFTQKIEFQSIHYHGHRPLTLVETIYFMSQVLTTVGHGDITPADEWGQLVVGSYVLFTVFLIADMVSAAVHFAIMKTEDIHELKLGSYKMQHSRPEVEELARSCQKDQNIEDGWLKRRPPGLPWRQLFIKTGVFSVFASIGALFYHFYPGENKSWFQGIYMSVITLSTVGFGAELPSTEAGKVFGAFWMLFGVASFLAVVSGFTELMLAAKALESWNEAADSDELTRLRLNAERLSDGTTGVSKYEFLKFSILHTKSMRHEDLEKIERTYATLASDSTGYVPVDSIEKAASA